MMDALQALSSLDTTCLQLVRSTVQGCSPLSKPGVLHALKHQTSMFVRCCSESNVKHCVKTAPGGSEHPDQHSGP